MAFSGEKSEFLCILDRRRKNGSKIVQNAGDILFVFRLPVTFTTPVSHRPCSKTGKNNLHTAFPFTQNNQTNRNINEKTDKNIEKTTQKVNVNYISGENQNAGKSGKTAGL